MYLPGWAQVWDLLFPVSRLSSFSRQGQPLYLVNPLKDLTNPPCQRGLIVLKLVENFPLENWVFNYEIFQECVCIPQKSLYVTGKLKCKNFQTQAEYFSVKWFCSVFPQKGNIFCWTAHPLIVWLALVSMPLHKSKGKNHVSPPFHSTRV